MAQIVNARLGASLATVLIAASTLGFVAPPAARADLTISLQATDTRLVRIAPPKAPVVVTETEYVSGNYIRVDFAGLSFICDIKSHKAIMLDNTLKTYSTSDLSAGFADFVLYQGSGAPNMAMPMQTPLRIVDTGKTALFLGHKACHYFETVSLPLGMLVRTDILAAEDFAPADTVAFDSLFALTHGDVSVQGVPVATTTVASGGGLEPYTVKQVATAISVAPLSPSEFQIPSGYTQTPMPLIPGMPTQVIPTQSSDTGDVPPT